MTSNAKLLISPHDEPIMKYQDSACASKKHMFVGLSALSVFVGVLIFLFHPAYITERIVKRSFERGSDEERIRACIKFETLLVDEKLIKMDDLRFGVPIPLYSKPRITDRFIPVYSNTPLGLDSKESWANIKHVVVSVHGVGRKITKAFCGAALAPSDTLFIAPYFSKTAENSSAFKIYMTNSDTDTAELLFWDNGYWMNGGDTTTKRTISNETVPHSNSFAVLDAIASFVKQRASFFGAELSSLTFSGFSAGGQTIQHWLPFTNMMNIMGNTSVNFIIGSPGSYTYYDSLRPSLSCRTSDASTTRYHTCDSFEEPNVTVLEHLYGEQADIYNKSNCNFFNEFRYGMDLGSMVNLSQSVTRFRNLDSNEKQARLQNLSNMSVSLLLGLHDVCNCNTYGYDNEAVDDYKVCFPELSKNERQCFSNFMIASNYEGCCDTQPAASSNAADGRCQALAQGTNRLQRGINFWHYTAQFFGVGKPPWGIDFFSGAHDFVAFYVSDAYQRVAFGKQLDS